jgi:hypothetical protein
MTSLHFTLDDMPSLLGKLVIINGASFGLCHDNH